MRRWPLVDLYGRKGFMLLTIKKSKIKTLLDNNITVILLKNMYIGRDWKQIDGEETLNAIGNKICKAWGKVPKALGRGKIRQLSRILGFHYI